MAGKLIKISLEYELEDESILVRSLENEDAEKWDNWLKDVCTLAYIHRKNPEWGSLNWKEETKLPLTETKNERG